MSGFLDTLPPHVRFLLGAALFLLGGGGFGWAAARWHQAGAVEAAGDAGYEEGREDMARELAGWAAGDERGGTDGLGQETRQLRLAEWQRALPADEPAGSQAAAQGPQGVGVERHSVDSGVAGQEQGDAEAWEPDGRLAAYARLPQPPPDLTGWPAWSTEPEPERELSAFWLDFYERDAAVSS